MRIRSLLLGLVVSLVALQVAAADGAGVNAEKAPLAKRRPHPKPIPHPQPPPPPRPTPIPPQPTPKPTPPQPPPVDQAEVQCRQEVPNAEYRLNSCRYDQRTLSDRERQEQYRRDDVNVQYQQAMRPLNACRDDLSRVQSQTSSLRSRINSEIDRRNSLISSLRETQADISEAQRSQAGALYKCQVVGRHATFVEVDASAAKALQRALAHCGQDNCGKSDWNQNWNCRLQ